MPEERTITVYKLEELSPKAKERALEKLSQWATDHDWWDFVENDAITIGKLLGFEVDDKGIAFSGFWSQGDGASFTGSYTPVTDPVKALQEYANDAKLLEIAKRLATLTEHTSIREFGAIIRRIDRHYSHENTVIVEVESHSGDPLTAEQEQQLNEIENELQDIARDFMRWIYRQLEDEYNYQTSEEQLTEMCDANDYRFHADGSIA